ncbi:MAG: guanylate kinase, partial [Burkholderiaceae bacterium]|nr:guanylate kinase [Burkholderiaceae bacterium]
EVFADALRDLQAILAASRLRTGPMMARYPALVKRLGA